MVLRNLALIGTGPWGQIYLKTLNAMGLTATTAGRQNWCDVIDRKPDGVIVCTPPESHIQIATYALDRGIPVIIEKPLSLSSEEAAKLSRFKLPILVNHSALFTDSFERIRRLTRDKPVSNVNVSLYNYGPFRSYSGLWDYGPHAIAIVLELLQEMPLQTTIKTMADLHNEPRAILYDIQLQFENSQATCLIGNGGAAKRRAYSVKTDGLTLMCDDMRRPAAHAQPLNNAIQVFLDALDGKDDWRLGLDLSVKVIRVLEKCHSILNSSTT